MSDTQVHKESSGAEDVLGDKNDQIVGDSSAEETAGEQAQELMKNTTH